MNRFLVILLLSGGCLAGRGETQPGRFYFRCEIGGVELIEIRQTTVLREWYTAVDVKNPGKTLYERHVEMEQLTPEQVRSLSDFLTKSKVLSSSSKQSALPAAGVPSQPGSSM